MTDPILHAHRMMDAALAKPKPGLVPGHSAAKDSEVAARLTADITAIPSDSGSLGMGPDQPTPLRFGAEIVETAEGGWRVFHRPSGLWLGYTNRWVQSLLDGAGSHCTYAAALDALSVAPSPGWIERGDHSTLSVEFLDSSVRPAPYESNAADCAERAGVAAGREIARQSAEYLRATIHNLLTFADATNDSLSIIADRLEAIDKRLDELEGKKP